MAAIRRDVYIGIADPTRRNILGLIADQPLNVNSIANNFQMSRPAISQHLKILSDCGLVVITKKGRERYFEPKLEALDEVTDWIEPLKKTWRQRFDRLDEVIQELKSK